MGVQAAVHQGADLQGVQGDALLHGLLHPPRQLRGGPELQGRGGPRRGRLLPRGRAGGRVPGGLDHHPLDPPQQPRPLCPPRHGLRQGEGQQEGEGLHHDGGQAGGVVQEA